MKISTSHLKRYKEIARLLWKYGRFDLVKHMDIDEAERPDRLEDSKPEQLADDLEAMGPTFIKLGQVLSGRPDLLSDPYLKALARLQDSVKPFPYGDVEDIITAELGVRISKAFSRFDTDPIAAASLGQVHGAALRDRREVVVKVQRPGIREQIAEDFDVLREIAEFLDAHTEFGRRYRFRAVLKEFRDTIQQELDYELEAQNLLTLGHNMADFKLIRVPQPVMDFTTRYVLTMEHIPGRKITSVGPLARMELNERPLVEELFKAYLKQVLVDGLFHADPHPGNVFLTEDKRIALLDLGMVGHTAPSMQESLLKVLMAVSEGKSDEVANLTIRMSQKTDGFDSDQFRQCLDQLLAFRHNRKLAHLNVGKSLLEVSRSAANNGLFVPSELTLLGKTLMQLDEVGKYLDPAFDPNAAVHRNVGDIMAHRMEKDATRGRLYTSLLEMKDFMAGLPARLNQIMDAVTNSELEIKVKSVDTKMLVDGIEKVANRIASGLVLAALIIGAAQLMKVPTTFQVFGYPGLAILLFLAAAAGGFWLVINIIIQDEKDKKERKKALR